MAQRITQEGDSHLRSGMQVIGYDIEASDGELGAVDDFVVDERTWAIRDMIVDTTKWWPGGEVRVPPQAVESIDYENRKVKVSLTREELRRRMPSA